MSRYLVDILVSKIDTVWVEADSPEAALAIVNADDFTYDDALMYAHDPYPGFIARHVELDEE